MMESLHHFGWIHRKAQAMRYGKLLLECVVVNGRIERVTEIERHESRTREESIREERQRHTEELLS